MCLSISKILTYHVKFLQIWWRWRWCSLCLVLLVEFAYAGTHLVINYQIWLVKARVRPLYVLVYDLVYVIQDLSLTSVSFKSGSYLGVFRGLNSKRFLLYDSQRWDWESRDMGLLPKLSTKGLWGWVCRWITGVVTIVFVTPFYF